MELRWIVNLERNTNGIAGISIFYKSSPSSDVNINNIAQILSSVGKMLCPPTGTSPSHFSLGRVVLKQIL